MELELNKGTVPSDSSGDVNNTNTSSENTPSEVTVTTQKISDETTVNISVEEKEEKSRKFSRIFRYRSGGSGAWVWGQ